MSHQTILNEQITVLAKFKNGVVTPLLFKLQNRTYKIESIDLKYRYREGNVDFYSYSVSAQGNSYKITYNARELTWKLEEIFAN